MHRRMLSQLWVSLQPSQAPSSQIYPPCEIPENPHGMLFPRVSCRKELTRGTVLL